MGRIRSVKPEVCKHEGLFDLEKSTGLPIRFAWVGLWTVCDREGRFKWRPRTMKADILPFDDLDFGAVLDALFSAGFIRKYEVDGETYGFIPSWRNHQTNIHVKEQPSTIPAPVSPSASNVACTVQGKNENVNLGNVSSEIPQNTVKNDAPGETGASHVACTLGREGKGKEGKGKGEPPPSMNGIDSMHGLEGESGNPIEGKEPSDLVQRWYFFNPGGKPVEAREIAAMYAELHRHGISDSDISTELENPKRIRGEWPSKFRDRMIAATKNRMSIKSPGESALAQALRAINEREVKNA